MKQEPNARKPKSRRRVVNAQGGRHRAAQLPDYRIPLIVPRNLFTTEDVWRLSDEPSIQSPALRRQPASEAESIRITQHLHHAFAWAVQCAKMQEWAGEPKRKQRWYEQVERRADDLLKALDLIPEGCADSTKVQPSWSLPVGLQEFCQSLDCMVAARPELPSELDALSRVVWDEGGSKLQGNGPDERGHCQYRGRASFLVGRLPRTIALLSALARLQSEELKRPRDGVPTRGVGAELLGGLDRRVRLR